MQDQAIVELARREVPELSHRDVDDARAAVLLREWTFRKILVVPLGEPESVELIAGSDAWRLRASGYLDVFARHEAGAYCGDAAWMLMRVYEAFGMESYVYNFGIADATHVLTLVRVGGDLVIEDAFFDYDVRDEHGTLLGLTTVLSRLRAHEHERLRRVEEDPFPVRDALMTDATHSRLLEGPDGAFVTAAQLRDCMRTDSGHWRCGMAEHRWDRLRFHPVLGEAALDRLAERGWPRHAEYLMMEPIGVSSSADGWTSFDRIREATPTAAVLRSVQAAVGGAQPGR